MPKFLSQPSSDPSQGHIFQKDIFRRSPLASPQASPWRHRGDVLVHRLTQGCAIALLLLVLAIAAELLVTALPAIQAFGLSFLVSSEWNPVQNVYGIAPQIYGTLVSSLVAIALVIPLGVGIAILLVEDLLPKAIRTPLSFAIELLAAVPSVVYGLWGIFILIPALTPIMQRLHQTLGWFPLLNTPPSHRALLPTILVLTLMMLPIVVALSRDALVAQSDELRQGAAAVGATRWETLVRILLPASLSGIVGGGVLALGRAMGETMAAVMLIGNANQIRLSLLAPGSTLASLVANQFSEARDLQVSALLYAALVLMGLTLVINVVATGMIQIVQAQPVQMQPVQTQIVQQNTPSSSPTSSGHAPRMSKRRIGAAVGWESPTKAHVQPGEEKRSATADAENLGHFSLWKPQRLGRSLLSWGLTGACVTALAIALVALTSIFFSLLTQGLARLDSAAFTQLPPPPLDLGGGFRNAIAGTLLMVGIGVGLSAPLGIGVGIYLVEFGRENRLTQTVRFFSGVLSGVPSILCGLFAYALVVLTTGTFSAIAGGVALSVLMVPITVRTAEEGLKAVPAEWREGAIALGATTSQSIGAIVLPAAAPSIVTGVVLAMARAVGETAPLLFTALFSQYGLNSVWNPVASLSVLIYNFALSPYPNHQALAWTAALVVVSLILGISVMARWVVARSSMGDLNKA